MILFYEISDGLIQKIEVTEIDLSQYTLELEEINKKIEVLKKEPDEILVMNMDKVYQITELENRIEEINKILNTKY